MYKKEVRLRDARRVDQRDRRQTDERRGALEAGLERRLEGFDGARDRNPVAVVALLKSLGASAGLTMIITGIVWTVTAYASGGRRRFAHERLLRCCHAWSGGFGLSWTVLLSSR